MQKLQDVTVTLDNNWDNKHVRYLFPVVNFLKCVVKEVLFSIGDDNNHRKDTYSLLPA